MSEERKHIVTEELLFRYFAGETDANEAALILTWKAASEENLVEFDKTYYMYLDINAISKINHPGKIYDVHSAWKKVKTQNQFKSSLTKKKGNSVSYLKIAASILIFIGVGWFVYNSYISSKELNVVAGNEILDQKMPDGSEVTLNRNSKISYPEVFGKKERNVKLEGEAYFSITKDPNRPFIINADKIQVEVLGTSFNVNATKNLDSIVVSVDTGKVMINAYNNHIILEAGTTGIYLRSTQSLMKVESKSVRSHNYWRTKILSFHSTQLKEVIETIEKAFQTKIVLSNPRLAECRISVFFEDESLENMLDIISTTLYLNVSNSGDQFILSGDGCE